VVIRIMAEDQYRLDDSYLPQIEALERSLQSAMEKEDQKLFFDHLGAVLTLVREKGDKVPYEEVIPSNIVLPASDMTLEEVKEYLDVDPAY
jgi:hypothetical protein